MIPKLRFVGWMFILIFCLIFLCPLTAFSHNDTKQVIITIDCLQTEEFWNLPCWTQIRAPKAWGLMSPYTPGSQRELSSFLTLGLGIPVAAPAGERGLAFHGQEILNDNIVSDIFSKQTGLPIELEQICLLDLNEQKINIQAQNPQATFGALGDIIRDSGRQRIVLGNSDLPQKAKRNTAYMIADSNGLVDAGWLGNGNQPTNYQKLLEYYLHFLDNELILIELGDLAKLEGYEKLFLPERFAFWRQKYLDEINEFLLNIINNTNLSKTRIIILVPNNSALHSIRSLLPLVMLGNQVEGGVLISPTTRRKGVVANIDLAPSILNYWHLDSPAFMTGRPIASKLTVNPLEELRLLNAKTNFINAHRAVIIKTYVFIQIITICLFLFLLLFKNNIRSSSYPIFLIILTSIPIIMLILGFFDLLNLAQYLFRGFLIGLVISIISYVFSKLLKNDLLAIICLITAVTIIWDLAHGSTMMQNSIFGYDAVREARFYGLGNEYMGILIGSSIIGVSFFWENTEAGHKSALNLPLSAFFFFLVLLFLGCPQWGTNVGGTIAGSIGLAITLLKLADYKISFKHIVMILIFMGLIIIFLILVNNGSNTEQQTHVGLLVNKIRQLGWVSLGLVMLRKLSINLKLIRYTNWSILFLVSLFSLSLVFYRPLGLIKEICHNYPRLTAGLIGTLIGSLVALVVNDSGIVAAATMMIFPVNVLLYLTLSIAK